MRLQRKVGGCTARTFYNLFVSPSIIRVIKSRRMRWVGHAACVGERRDLCKVLVGKSEGKRPLGRLRLRWEDSNKTHHYSAGGNE